MNHPSVVPRSAPWILALAWLPGTAAFCCLSMADTYAGTLDPPMPPTSWTWTFLTLHVFWTLLVPAAGLTISLRRHQGKPALLHGAMLVGAALLSYAGYEFVT